MKQILLASLSIVLLTTSCIGQSTSLPTDRSRQQDREGKRIVAAIQGTPRILNSKADSAGSGATPGVDNVEEMIHAGLVSADNQGRLQPQLGDSVPSIDNGLWQIFPDGTMETTYLIRPGVSWHDGVPLTTADLLFTLQVSDDRQVPLFIDSASGFIEEMEAVDDSTLVVRWKRPYIDADALFSRVSQHLLPLPEHLLSEDYDERPEAFADVPYWTVEFVGLGPYAVEDFQRGSHMLLRASDYWPLGRPKVDEIEIRFFSDSNSMIAGILSGQVHMSLGRGISLDQALQVRDLWREGQVIFSYINWDAIYPQYLDPNPRLITDARFRRALLELIDRQGLVDSLMGGLVPIAHVYMSPQDPAYGEVAAYINRYDYDPARAAQDFADAGMIRDSGGHYRDFTGTPLPDLELRTTDQIEIQPKAMFAVADQWERGGFGVDRVVVPNQLIRDREYRATMPGFELVRQPNETSALIRLHSNQVPLPQNGFTGLNRSRYRSFELDSLIDRYTVTVPTAERMDVLRAIVRFMTDQAIWLGLFYEVEPALVDNRIKNVGGRGMLATESWNVAQWEMP